MAKTTEQRPSAKDYVGNAHGYIDAMRRYQGLSFRNFAEAVRRGARGKHRQGSENYLYRLCQGATQLKPELVDGIARALQLQPRERAFLKQNAASRIDDKKNPASRQHTRLLLKTLAGAGDGQLDVASMQAIIQPATLALYTLAGAGNLTEAELVATAAQGATDGKSGKAAARKALRTLLDLGALAVVDGVVRQAQPGADLTVQIGGRLGDTAKSQAMKVFYANLDAWGSEALFSVGRDRRRFQSLIFLTDERKLAALHAELAEGWTKLATEIRRKYETSRGKTVVHAGLRAWPMIEAAHND